ncbi:MAG: glutamine--fructose-6-phosphate transaminase (isomerizing) [Clostridia bacterium]
MCGIVGYVGDKKCAGILVNGLKKLEYRGYDSAGIALFEDDQIEIIKCKGRLVNLEEKVNASEYASKMGIGHTRWATHGAPNDVNSHPHKSQSGKFAVVHNGIIENYIKLRASLKKMGYVFLSDTDTEVIAHLIEHNYKGNLLEAVRETIALLEGTYALGVICTENPDCFVAARKESPLIVGLGEGENYIASDIPAIIEYTRSILILEDGEVVEVKANSVKVYDEIGSIVVKEPYQVTWDVESAEKGGYEHFMMKEMCEEPRVVKDTLSPRFQKSVAVAVAIEGEEPICGARDVHLDDISLTPEQLSSIDKIFIVACGTAYHAGVVGKYVIEKFARIPVEVDVASEFRYRNALVSERNLVIIISQSGETLDTLVALKECKKRGARVLSIVNVVGSSIARESDDVLYTMAGPEIAVASTKAYNTQLAAIYLLGIHLAKMKNQITDEFKNQLISELEQVPKMLSEVLEKKDDIAKFAAQHYNAKSIFFIGRGLDYALSMEGSLKLKEISYVHSEAYAGGELKHGTIALIEKGTLVVCPVTQDYLIDKIVSNIIEVKARGAVVLAVTQARNFDFVSQIADEVICIPDVSADIAPLLAVTPLQLFAYYMAVEKGCDVDKPRNLAKSVTVE